MAAGLDVLTCSALAREVAAVLPDLDPTAHRTVLDSALHLEPQRLATAMGEAVDRSGAAGRRVLLVFGECHACMDALCRREGVAWAPVHNCAALLMGQEAYRHHRRAGAFFVLDEWARRWREIVPRALGLPDDLAAGLLRRQHSHLLHLDTGLGEVPRADLDACSAWSGLPWRSLAVGLDPLRQTLASALASR